MDAGDRVNRSRHVRTAVAKPEVGTLPRKPRKKPRIVPQSHGGALHMGPNDGNGGGRPPDEFKRRMREIASNDDALDFLRACANGEFGAQFAIKAQEYAAERGYGKEIQEIKGQHLLVVRSVEDYVQGA